MLSRYFITALAAASTAFAEITDSDGWVCNPHLYRHGFSYYKADKSDFERVIPEYPHTKIKFGDIFPLNNTAAATEISQLVSEGLLTPIKCS